MIIKATGLSRVDVERLLKRGARSRDHLFALYTLPSPVFKLAVSVSKKVSQKATIRNLIKRRVKEAIKKASPGKYEIFIVVLKDVHKEKYSKLVESIEGLLAKTRSSLRGGSY